MREAEKPTCSGKSESVIAGCVVGLGETIFFKLDTNKLINKRDVSDINSKITVINSRSPTQTDSPPQPIIIIFF